jgi:amino acid adenylation domain-containing protein
MTRAELANEDYEADVFLASPAQEGLWFVEQLNPGLPVFTAPLVVRLAGALDVGVLRRCLAEVVARHEALRTTFTVRDDRVVQVVHGGRDADLRVVAAVPGGVEVEELLEREVRVPFDLERGPLLRALLIQEEADRYVLVVTVHHIVTDGWSVEVLLRELGELYGAFVPGAASPLADLPVQYADYAAWQWDRLGGDRLERDLEYWRERLAGAPAVLDLPTDHARPVVQSFRGGSYRFVVGAELSADLRVLARERGVTLFMLLLAAYDVLLYRYSGETDILVGTAVVGRPRAELEGLIGFFMNSLVLRASLSGSPVFGDFLEQVRETVLGATSHQELPFEKLVEDLNPQRTGRKPLHQVSLLFQSQRRAKPSFPTLEASRLPAPLTAGQSELTLSVEEAGAILEVEVEYGADLYEPETVDKLTENYLTLLRSIVADPRRRIDELEILAPGQRGELLSLSANPAHRPAEPSTVSAAFAAIAAERADAVALTWGPDGRLSYADLDRRANRLAHHLLARGVQRGAVVGLYFERGPELIIAMLAVLKAGAAYLPLAPSYPDARLASVAQRASASMLLAEDQVPPVVSDAVGGAVIRLADAANEIAASPATAPRRRIGPQDLAYVIFTSGSTGRPKGAMIPHGALLNWSRNYADVLQVRPDSRVSQLFPTTFDVSTGEIFVALLSGATLCLPDVDDVIPGSPVARFLARERITVANFVPSLLQALPDTELPDMECFAVGGEVLPRSLVDRWSDGERLFVNCYGPTETTITATTRHCPPGEHITIGRPMGNVRVHVLDAWLEPVPAGVAGEIFIGGRGVAGGYVGEPGLTAERFVPDPFGGAGERLYRTGDLGRYTVTGELEFVGRVDDQIKIRGYRVEPAEVKEALESLSAVRDAAVVADVGEDGHLRLAAYVVAANDNPLVDSLREGLAEILPPYMIPAALVFVDAIPVTAHGKLDRSALPPVAGIRPVLASKPTEPRSELESQLKEIWENVLDIRPVGIFDDFFELGGHSLMAVRLLFRIRRALGIELTTTELVARRSIAELAEYIGSVNSPEQAVEIIRADRTQPLPASPAQAGMWIVEQLNPGSSVYVAPLVVRLLGDLDAEVLRRCLAEVVARHESLRTTFVVRDDGVMQVVGAGGEVDLPIVDVGAGGLGVQELVQREIRIPFDLERGPLLRALLVHEGGDRHVLVVTMHHVVTDFWSVEVLMRELGELYVAFAGGGGSPLADLPVQYPDYAAWLWDRLGGDQLEPDLEYWRRRLAGASTVLALPIDHERPAVQSFRGGSHRFVVNAEMTSGLRGLARERGVTLFMVMLAAYDVLLHMYSGETDILVGTAVAGRPRAELEGLIGFFVNTLVLRSDLSGDPGFDELLEQVRETVLEATSHQDLPFAELVKDLSPRRGTGPGRLFQVWFGLNQAPSRHWVNSGLDVDMTFDIDVEIPVANDLNLQVMERDSVLEGLVEYSADLFEPETIERMAGTYRTLLARIMKRPHATVQELVGGLDEHEVRQAIGVGDVGRASAR